MKHYVDLIQRLFAVNLHGGTKLGLDNMKLLCAFLGNPEKCFASVHVAGTNGKGSVTTKTAKGLELSGYRVGMYTSPHLSCFRERIQVNGQLIPEDKTVSILSRIFEIIDEEKIPATFFEITTCLAFTYFAQQDVDIAVIETGLGGRLDATNVILPLLSIITSISLEHTEILGDNIQAITFEKTGIIKPGVPIIIGPRVSRDIVEPISLQKNSRLIALDGIYSFFDEENSAIARCALQELANQFPLTQTAINEGLKKRPPCRLEIFTCSEAITWKHKPFPPFLILDVAHNPDGLLRLFTYLKETYPKKLFRIVFGISKTKDVISCLKVLTHYLSTLYLVTAPNGRGIAAQDLVESALACKIPKEKVSAFSVLEEGVLKAIHEGATSQEPVLICGTFFIMRDARKLLGIAEAEDPIDLNERKLS